MPLVLNGNDIESPSGDSGTYTWADVLALNSPGIVTGISATPAYQINCRILLRGTSRLNILRQTLHINHTAATVGFKAQDSARINFGEEVTVGGVTYYRNGCNLHIRGAAGAVANDPANAPLSYSLRTRTLSTSRLNLFGCRVFYRSSNSRGNLFLSNVKRCVFDTDMPSENPSVFLYLQLGGSFDNNYFSRCAVEYLGAYNSLSGNISVDSSSALVNYVVGLDSDVRAFESVNATLDYYRVSSSRFDFIDCPSIDLTKGRVEFFGSSTVQAEDYKLFSQHLALVDALGSPVANAEVTYSGFTNLIQTSNASGILPVAELISQRTNVVGRTGAEYSSILAPIPVVDVSSYSRIIKHYLYNEVNQLISANSTVGTPNNPVRIPLILDAGVTVTNTATVAGYTGISHTMSTITISSAKSEAEIYDSRKWYWRNTANVVAPSFGGGLGNLGATNITIAVGGSVTTHSKFTQGIQTSGILTLEVARVYNAPFALASGGSVRVTSGLTQLLNWTFAPGTVINNTSSSAATVYVAPDQLSNVTAANPTAGGGSLTIQAPPASLRLFGIPSVANAILMVKDLTTNIESFPPLVNGEATVTVVEGRTYRVRAKAPGYLASRFVDIVATANSEFEFNLVDYRSLYESGTNRSAQIGFNSTTYAILINDDLPSYSFADVFRTLEDYLATQQGLAYTAHPYPLVLPDRNILWFPYDTTNNQINPVKIHPDPSNTSDPALLFEVYLEGASDTTYDLFDFSGANGRIIRVRTQLAIANVSVSGGLSPEDRAVIDTIATRTNRVNALIENSNGDRFTQKALEAAPSSSGGSGGFTDADRTTLNSRASQTSVDALPVPPNATDIATAVNSALQDDFANVTVDLTPITTAIGNLNDLSANDIRSELQPELSRIDATITSRASQSSVNALPSATTILSTINAGLDKTGYSLSPGERSLLAVAIESALINDGDGQQLIDAILQVINSNLDLPALELVAIGQAVRSELAIELSRIDATIGSRARPSDVQITVDGGFTLSDRTKLNSIPSNPLLASNYTAPNNAVIDRIESKVDSIDAELDELNVSVDLTPVLVELESKPGLDEIQAILPAGADNTKIEAIEEKVNQITITNGKVEAVVDNLPDLDQQSIRDAMALNLSNEVIIEPDSVDAKLGSIESDLGGMDADMQIIKDQATIAARNTQD